MLPDPLLELFEADTAELPPAQRARHARIASLVHADQVQAMTVRTAAAKFAHAHRLNLIDFQVLQTVVASRDADRTATPGSIAEQLSLSASTLTSILERLVARGLLVRERDSADRRRISVYYTEGSARLVMDFYRQLTESYDRIYGSLDDDEIRSRVEFLTALTDCHQRVCEELGHDASRARSA
ncbi:MarR family winged helix-turn-helix transcriptional regulator [Brevibacterium ihuae]|uniref:MarR family winged helix-turn-helix transcriptional regulator n=1 Tax=Brevibacterium ihuae TaxID=1631743 RepID=UPI000C77431D|nr:MarR family transcriptional regulator [Brevibacterium ihuae]